jgi:HAE1 family hydrophobic/amphiphilic exporter-1
MITLAEVADIIDGHRDVEQYQRLNGRPAASISIMKQSSANTITTVANAQAKLAQIKRLHPELKFREVYNQSDFVGRAVHSLVEAAVLGGGLAMLVVFFFLRNFRSTLVVGTSIPVSIISTFSFLYILGYTLNTMSLVGLAMAAGLIVDDAVVVLESIYRLMEEEGMDPVEASIQGTRSNVSAVISSTITIMVVFFPILLVPGQTGQMFKQFAMVIIVCMAFSLLDALTGVPMLCSQFLRRPQQPAEDHQPGFWERLFARWTGWFHRLDQAYTRLLAWAMPRRWRIVLSGFAVTALSLLLTPFIGFEFMPTSDTGTVRVALIMPSGSALERTDKAMREVEKVLAAHPDVESYLTTSGEGGRDKGIAWVSLKNSPQRSPVGTINMQLMVGFSQIPGAQAYPFTMDLVNIMVSGSMGDNVELDIFGPDLDQLSKLSKTFLEAIRSIPGCADMRDNAGAPGPEIRWVVDRARASKLGLSFVDVGTALQTAGAGKTASYFQEGGTRSPIVVQLAAGKRRTLDKISEIIVNSRVASDQQSRLGSTGNAPRGVMLGQVAEAVRKDGSSTINRRTRQRYKALVGSGEGRSDSEIQRDVGKALSNVSLPPGYFWDWSSKMKAQTQEMRSLGMAVVLAIVLIYMLLCIQFENLIIPLSIMLSVPLCLLGVVLGLFFSGTSFSVMAGIGCLMLVGIAVKNGILLVEHTVQERAHGLAAEAALLKACPSRLRPILITAGAAILGMVPIALRGRGGEMEAPMAIAIIGGLFASTLLTLVIVPMAYLIFDDLENRFFKKRPADA